MLKIHFILLLTNFVCLIDCFQLPGIQLKEYIEGE